MFRNLMNNVFTGPPSTGVDEAWNELLAPMHIRVSKEELERNGQSSVALPESGGHLAWLGVFHDLHCIVSSLPIKERILRVKAWLTECHCKKMLRQWIYRDVYHPDLTTEEEKHWFSHAGERCY